MYPGMEMDDGTYFLKSMNCPHHHLIYLHEPKSYRDLPIRIAEYGTVYTPKEIEKWEGIDTAFITGVLKKGKVLYG
jgi:threonyl-tRNA synthetase